MFDLDGTLVDSAGDIASAINELLASEGHAPFSLEDVIRFIGDGITALVQRAFMARDVVLGADELPVRVAQFKKLYESRATDLTRPYSGVPELISNLRKRGIAVGICTNKEEGLAQKIVDALGLSSQLDVVVGARPNRPAKPSPVSLLETVASLGASREEAIMVGDSAIDMRCAQYAGIPFIGVTFGYSNPPMSELSADVAIESYQDFDAACDFLRDQQA
ncbi:HAD-IA family hydrolase [[Pseudomonas] carboxydohydrogena]|uniref:phosphoglycolate phosphatase n=1 Tax=Afipia carboxydohydrogena TaxID=290 RepID=A0ABY8BQU6_AFICR|nr:HAD-IA family hydrolase [[Pseudomonas] carboxydohydrogena]WEF51060.1 HAD-IA family hydrolase [[Pseudomonas] carboxydohydrogena]